MRILWLFVLVMYSVVGETALAARPVVQRFASFEQLRDVLVAKIARAKQRVWLISPFMSDYDISLALYVALFRKIDVRVVLGQERLRSMLSQYGYLRAQQIMVRATTGIGKTVLICDNRMYRLNSDLDFLSERRDLVLRRVTKPDIEGYALALGVVASPVHGKVYDYSRKRHQRPEYISGYLPQRTIRTLNKKLSGGSS